ncbi:transcriptional regulator [Zhongshania sp.]|jgi:DNA-binding transcriptional regulator YdaS (Cro superfamily)|uniref:transcriptional regulator n=1 Tax=Zhongshania sp. TaxID=1971902 RepID=UPI0039C6000A
MSKKNPLIIKASNIVGSQTELAKRIGMKKQFLSQLAKGERPVPSRWGIPIERATAGQVTRYELCPEVFGSAPASIDSHVA